MATQRAREGRVVTAMSWVGAGPERIAKASAWIDYERRNKAANVEYRLRPSIVPLIVDSLDNYGLGPTAHRFGIAPGALAVWFPELIELVPSERAGSTS